MAVAIEKKKSMFAPAATTIKVRRAIIDDLVNSGHKTYAQIFSKYRFYLLDPEFEGLKTAATDKTGKKIFLNAGLNGKETIRIIIIHEILHGWLEHERRYMDVFLKAFPDIKDQEFYLNKSKDFHDVINWVMDFEISNKAYSDKDKVLIRKVLTDFFGTLTCLVTEDHQQWEKMTLEEMLDKVFTWLRDDKANRALKIWQAEKWGGLDPNREDEGGGGGGGDDDVEIVKGYLIDPTTFVDEDGNTVNPD